MSVLDLLKPSPHLEEIKDEGFVKKEYKYWRLRTFYGMYIGYAAYYLTRKSFACAMPDMLQAGYDKIQLGVLLSISAIVYGASKFFSGVLSDKSNPRYFMGLGLIFTGVFNILFGFSSSLLLFSLFWGMNALFQGWGWPPCGKLLTHWYSHSERGRWWSTWNTSHNLGGIGIPYIAAVILANFANWRYVMYAPGIITILIGLFVINRLRDTPQSLGLPPVEKFRNDYISKSAGDVEQEENLTAKQILFQYVLKNKYIWILAIAYMFIYIVRGAMDSWATVFLVEHKGYASTTANKILCFFEAGGFLGSLAAGWSSDFFCKGMRGPINALFSILILVPAILLWQSKGLNIALDSVLIFSLGFFIFGPQMMIGMAAAEVSHRQAVGTATGFAGNFSYLGMALAGLPLGLLLKNFGWDTYFIVMIVAVCLASLLLFPLWGLKASSKCA